MLFASYVRFGGPQSIVATGQNGTAPNPQGICMESNSTFDEFRDYWKLSELLIANATKEELAEAIRIFAMHSANYARKFGELEIPDLDHLLSAPESDDESVGLLRDGAIALVGVLGSIQTASDETSDGLVH